MKSSGVGGGQPSKKSKGLLATYFNSGTKREQVLESMISRYKRRQILLKAQDIYGRGKVPSGKEEYLFQYIDSINEDCKTAILKYEEKCIANGGHQFTNYPDNYSDYSDYSAYYASDKPCRYLARVIITVDKVRRISVRVSSF